ncbi:MAG TPA: helix-turn-helix domain-containing protein [Conexibacter sp.]
MASHEEALETARDGYERADAAKEAADQARVRAAHDAHEDGWALRRIARHLGVSHTIVARLLRR